MLLPLTDLTVTIVAYILVFHFQYIFLHLFFTLHFALYYYYVSNAFPSHQVYGGQKVNILFFVIILQFSDDITTSA